MSILLRLTCEKASSSAAAKRTQASESFEAICFTAIWQRRKEILGSLSMFIFQFLAIVMRTLKQLNILGLYKNINMYTKRHKRNIASRPSRNVQLVALPLKSYAFFFFFQYRIPDRTFSNSALCTCLCFSSSNRLSHRFNVRT